MLCLEGVFRRNVALVWDVDRPTALCYNFFKHLVYADDSCLHSLNKSGCVNGGKKDIGLQINTNKQNWNSQSDKSSRFSICFNEPDVNGVEQLFISG